jgi:hypothetical protein
MTSAKICSQSLLDLDLDLDVDLDHPPQSEFLQS